MKKAIFIFCVFLGISTSCDLLSEYDLKQIEIETEQFNPELCVFANYFQNMELQVDMSITKSILDLEDISINKAKIILTNDVGSKLYVDTLLVLDPFDEYLKTNKGNIPVSRFLAIPHEGDSLKIIIKVEGYDQVEGITYVPEMVKPESIKAQKLISDEELYQFTLAFTDPVNFSNYYLVSSIYDKTIYEVPYENLQYRFDTITEVTRYQIPLTDPVFELLPNEMTSLTEPFDITKYKPRIFSSEAFDGQKYGLKINIPLSNDSYWDAPYRTTVSNYSVELFSISKELFEGYKSYFLNRVVKGDIYAEPLTLFSNMNNNVGLFGVINGPASANIKLPDNDILQFDWNQ